MPAPHTQMAKLNMKDIDIYGLGAGLVDTEIEVSDADLDNLQVEKGLMTLVDEKRQTELLTLLADHMVASKRACGGSATNTIIAAQYFGAQTYYSCKVANDDNGAFYLNDIRAAGVGHPDQMGKTDGITGKCLVLITPDAERTMNTFLGVSETLSTKELDEAAIQRSRYVYIEGYLVTSATGKPAAIELKRLAEQHNCQTALSLSDPGIVSFFHDGLKEMIGSGVDILFCNEDEALQYTQTEQFDDAYETLKQSAKTFAITRGALGSVVFDGNSRHDVPSDKVKAVDTNGAGDMFAGAFLYCLSKGLDYATAAQFANRAAAKVVSQFGPRLRPEQYTELSN